MPSPDQSLGWTVPERSRGSVFQPKHAVLHHTETQCLRDLSLEKGALKVVCCNKRTKSWMGKTFFFLFVCFLFWLRRTYNTHKKRRKKNNKRQTKRVNDLYVWCMMFWGTSPGQQIHWYFTKLSEVSMCALWMSEIGEPAPWEDRRRVFGEEMDWWMVRGWYQCCCGLNGFLGGSIPLVFPRWQREDGARMEVPACLSGTQTGGGVLRSFWGLGFDQREKVDVCLVSDPGTKTPPPSGHCMTGAFFGVFGAATKCAMCYVAWFIIFLQATKLICSPIV